MSIALDASFFPHRQGNGRAPGKPIGEAMAEPPGTTPPRTFSLSPSVRHWPSPWEERYSGLFFPSPLAPLQVGEAMAEPSWLEPLRISFPIGEALAELLG
jgi:hypothetical protein